MMCGEHIEDEEHKHSQNYEYELARTARSARRLQLLLLTVIVTVRQLASFKATHDSDYRGVSKSRHLNATGRLTMHD
jgi:hypothetical protein